MRGLSKGGVTIGKPLRYALSVEEAGYCYLLRIDSHSQWYILSGDICAIGDSTISARQMIPSNGSIEAEAPVGRETVIALLSQGPIQLAPDLTKSEAPVWRKLSSDEDRNALLSSLTEYSARGALARSDVSYSVNTPEGGLQFTTRAILRQVSEAGGSGDTGSQLTTFNVDAITFELDTAVATPRGQLQLDAFGEALRDPMLADKRVIVAGHTDDTGDPEYNIELSRKRAEAVKQYFNRNFQVASDRIDTQALGEAQPRVANSDEDSRAMNRRVEITFLY
ncbi:MAG: OmpA family protein [Halioglobus sp.]